MEFLDFRESINIQADYIKDQKLGMNDKILKNKELVSKISKSETREMKRKQLYQKQIQRHDKIMNKIKVKN